MSVLVFSARENMETWDEIFIFHKILETFMWIYVLWSHSLHEVVVPTWDLCSSKGRLVGFPHRCLFRGTQTVWLNRIVKGMVIKYTDIKHFDWILLGVSRCRRWIRPHWLLKVCCDETFALIIRIKIVIEFNFRNEYRL